MNSQRKRTINVILFLIAVIKYRDPSTVLPKCIPDTPDRMASILSLCFPSNYANSHAEIAWVLQVQ